jgi:polysaccharide export outer membrane protein
MTTAGKNTMARSTHRQNTSTMRQRTAWRLGVLPLGMLLLAGCGLFGAPAASRPTLTNGISHEYIIGAGDVLEILVWRNETLSRTVTVRPDGKISLPLINDVQAAGLTPMQLREQIVQEMKTFKELPEVSIIVIDAKSRVVYLMGQVARPGAYPLGPNATVLQVIAQAGGFTQFADSNNILVIRRGDGTSKEQRIQVSYRSILKGQSTKGDVALQAGDTVIVP